MNTILDAAAVAADNEGPRTATTVASHPLYSVKAAAKLARVSYRQIDYWASRGFVRPSIEADGSGSARRYSLADILALRVVGFCSRIGMNPRAVAPLAAEIASWLELPGREVVIDLAFPDADAGGSVLRIHVGELADELRDETEGRAAMPLQPGTGAINPPRIDVRVWRERMQ